MLCFAAITPHAPVLIPGIGKEHLATLDPVVTAMKQLANDLVAAKPDVVIILTPQGKIFNDGFAVNLTPEYTAHYKKFGDFSTTKKFLGNFTFYNQSRERIERVAQLIAIHEHELDHGSSVPLFYLLEHLPQTPILPISTSLLDWATHVAFGNALKEEILNSELRIAVITSGNLGHQDVKTTTPNLDRHIIDALFKHDLQELLQLPATDITKAEISLWGTLLIQLGILQHMNYRFTELCYQNAFNVGYLVARLDVQ